MSTALRSSCLGAIAAGVLFACGGSSSSGRNAREVPIGASTVGMPPEPELVAEGDAGEAPVPWIECEHFSFAWGVQHRGVAVDTSGVAVAYEGGPPVEGERVSEAQLEKKTSYGRRQIQRFSAEEIAAQRALVDEAVQGELKSQPRHVYDGPSESCQLYVPEDRPGWFRVVYLERSTPTEHVIRDGDSARQLLAWARAIRAMAPRRGDTR